MPSTFKITEKGWRSDMGRIVLGLVLFVVVMLIATFYNVSMGKAGQAPVMDKPSNSKSCIKPTQWMRENHMKLLDDWREEVVREGKRGHVEIEGVRYEKSLTAGCMRCHQSKARFCDRCHQWAGVTRVGTQLECFTCHIQTAPRSAAVAAEPARAAGEEALAPAGAQAGGPAGAQSGGPAGAQAGGPAEEGR